MQITFAAAADGAGVTALVVEKDGLARAALGDARPLATAAAAATRFTGEAGSIVELFVPAGADTRHLLLLGIGGGAEPDWAKAGGALTAKLLTSGTTAVTVDLTGASATPAAVAPLRRRRRRSAPGGTTSIAPSCPTSRSRR